MAARKSIDFFKPFWVVYWSETVRAAEYRRYEYFTSAGAADVFAVAKRLGGATRIVIKSCDPLPLVPERDYP